MYRPAGLTEKSLVAKILLLEAIGVDLIIVFSDNKYMFCR